MDVRPLPGADGTVRSRPGHLCKEGFTAAGSGKKPPRSQRSQRPFFRAKSPNTILVVSALDIVSAVLLTCGLTARCAFSGNTQWLTFVLHRTSTLTVAVPFVICTRFSILPEGCDRIRGTETVLLFYGQDSTQLRDCQVRFLGIAIPAKLCYDKKTEKYCQTKKVELEWGNPNGTKPP